MSFQDLHRTGCSWFCEFETPEERAILKRVLLAYARWNKTVGYCQGFNVIAALILQVMERSEEDALKVMVIILTMVVVVMMMMVMMLLMINTVVVLLIFIVKVIILIIMIKITFLHR